MRGRKPKPTAEKIRNGSAAHNPQRLNQSEPPAIGDEPAMPDYFGDYAVEAWKRITGIMRTMGYLSASYAHTLEAYCTAYEDFRTARDHVRENGYWLVDDKKTENLRRNPAAIEMRQSRDTMCKLLSEFGMTPSSKTRVCGDGPKELDDPLQAILDERKSWTLNCTSQGPARN